MDLIKTATEWAKDEVFSSIIFIIFGVLFIGAAIGFWQFGRTEMANAYIYPTLVAGSLLLLLGIGLLSNSKSLLSNMETEYKKDPKGFVQAEIQRTEKTIGDYENIALKVFPAVIILAALLVIFVSAPIWKAIGITAIALLTVVMLIDSNALARIKTYHHHLTMVEVNER